MVQEINGKLEKHRSLFWGRIRRRRDCAIPGSAAAKRADVEVTLVSRDNFTLFTPMLDEVQPAISSRPTSAILFANCFDM